MEQKIGERMRGRIKKETEKKERSTIERERGQKRDRGEKKSIHRLKGEQYKAKLCQ